MWLCAPLALAQPDRVNGRAFATRSPVLGQHGMVCTSQPLASQIGINILKAGGSAVDAAINWDAKTKKLHGLNASGRSPLGLSLDRLKAEPAKTATPDRLPPRGFLPISAPGCVDGWAELHQKFGQLPLRSVLAPARRYAEQGFPVTQAIAYGWAIGVRHAQLDQFPGAFLDTFAPAEGQIFKNPALARTLTLIGQHGRDAYDRGEIAEKPMPSCAPTAAFSAKPISSRTPPTWVDPVSVNYRGYDVYELPPNSQGIAALQMLTILEGFDLAQWGYNSADALQLLIEAKKLAFEDRAKFYADPAFAKIPLQGLLSKTCAAARRKLIGPRAAKTYDSGHHALRDGDTIYLCTADAEGNRVSLIQSNYRGMGSGIVVPGLGFAFQDRGEMFPLEPGHANVYAPGKRPFQTIIPGFVLKDGQPWQAFGLMGGGMQPQGHVQVLVNQIDFGMNIQEAGDAARWHREGSSEPTGEKMRDGGYVQVEHGVPYESQRALVQRGHDVRGGFGGYPAIRWDR